MHKWIDTMTDDWPDPHDVLVLGKIKFPASVHVFGVVSDEDGIIPSHFFKKAENVINKVYSNVL